MNSPTLLGKDEAIEAFRDLVSTGICCASCGMFISAVPQKEQRRCLECSHVSEAKDHPIEDMYGSEIQTGDTWFKDQAGRIVLLENVENYLIEVACVEMFKEIK